MSSALASTRRSCKRLVAVARNAMADRRGALALTFALLLPLLMLVMVGAIDLSSIVANKNHLQDATDSAALAVSAATSETPTIPESTLKTLATNMLNANFKVGTVALTDFHVCAPSQNDCTTGSGQTMKANTVALTTTTQAPCYVAAILPGVCNSNGLSQVVTVSNTSNIGIPSNIQINMLLDVSGSMIVGSTPNDVQAVETWNNNNVNWAKVNFGGDSSQSRPCAFACHDEGPSSSGVNGPTTSGSANSDMQAGQTNAHAAGATTRFDVMLSAASNLLTHVQNEVGGNTQLAKNSYFFNVSTIADSLTQVYKATAANDWTDPSTAIKKLYVGLDTHLNANMPTFASNIGTSGNGATTAAPIKFVILVTDGLQSDFYSDFYSCTSATPDTPWDVPGYYGANSASPNWYGYYETGCYAAPMVTTPCATMKSNGVIVAVLETPYVPLTGQDPNEQYLYETWVRHTIYPGGPNSSSTVSAALQACASSGYYYQASSSDPTTISQGFVTLTDKFLASTNFIRQ